MATATVNAEAIRTTINQVLGILGDLQTRLDNDEETELSQGVESVLVSPRCSRAGGGDIVDARSYTEKCKELDDMALKYSSKCKEYDQLLGRYLQLQGRKQEQRAPSLTSLASLTARQNQPAKVYTFEDFDELEKKMCPQGSGGRGKRTSGGVLVSPARDGPSGMVQHRSGTAFDNITPTKRARKDPLATRKPNLLSSPPPPLLFKDSKPSRPKRVDKRTFHAAAEPRLHGDAVAGVKCSSQETRLDSSDPCFPSEGVIELCPATDDEDSGHEGGNINSRDRWRDILDQIDDVPQEQANPQNKSGMQESGATTSARPNGRPKMKPTSKSSTKPNDQRSVDLQRILDAIGDCQPCRTFYSMPGLALPKRDPTTLCMHKGKGKTPSSAPEAAQAQATPARNVPPAARSERRPSTPEHFWDIDYFPAIRTAGPEVLRKSGR